MHPAGYAESGLQLKDHTAQVVVFLHTYAATTSVRTSSSPHAAPCHRSPPPCYAWLRPLPHLTSLQQVAHQGLAKTTTSKLAGREAAASHPTKPLPTQYAPGQREAQPRSKVARARGGNATRWARPTARSLLAAPHPGSTGAGEGACCAEAAPSGAAIGHHASRPGAPRRGQETRPGP